MTSAKTVSAADGITGYRLTVADDSETILDSGVGMTSDFILTDIMPGTYEVTAYGYASDGIDDAAVARSTEIMTLEKGGEYSIMLDDPIEGKTGEIVIEAIPPYSGVYTHDRDTLSIGYIDGRNEAIRLSTADGSFVYEGDENGVWHYRIAAGTIPSGNAIMTLSVTSDDGNTAERMAMAVLFPELRHTAREGDFDFREGKEKVATPIINITKSLKPSIDSIGFVSKAPDVDTLIITINNTDTESSEIFRYHYQSGEFYNGNGIKTRMLYIRADIGSLYGGSSEDQLIEKMRDVVSFGLTSDGPWYSVESWQSLGLFGCESSYEIPEQLLEATVLYIRIIDLQGREIISEPIAIGETNIEISCTTPNAEIYYTLDGTEPNQFSTLYVKPFAVTAPITIKAKAFKEGMDPSNTAENIIKAMLLSPSVVQATTTMIFHIDPDNLILNQSSALDISNIFLNIRIGDSICQNMTVSTILDADREISFNTINGGEPISIKGYKRDGLYYFYIHSPCWMNGSYYDSDTLRRYVDYEVYLSGKGYLDSPISKGIASEYLG